MVDERGRLLSDSVVKWLTIWLNCSEPPTLPQRECFVATSLDGYGFLHYLAIVEGTFSGSPQAKRMARTLARLALENGASAHAVENEMGNSPAHFCVWNGAAGTMEGLFDGNGVVHFRNRREETPLELCEFLLSTIRFIPGKVEEMFLVRKILLADLCRSKIEPCCQIPVPNDGSEKVCL